MGKARTMSRARGHSGASADSRGNSRRGSSLTASERAYMIRKAKEASVALVDHAHTLDGPVQWHYTGKFRGIQMYRGEGSYDRVGTTGTEFLCGVTTMMGSIEEVASYFDQQTTARMVAKKADDVLDCGVLYSLVQGDPNNPFYRVSAKYQLYEGPSAFSRERDYCFLECQNTFRHASGRRGWVLSMHSIKLPNCPEVDGVVRGSMYQSGYVFVEAEKEGYMDVMHSLQINFKSTSRLPHFLLNSALKRRILSVVTISREIQTSRMGRQTLLKKKDLMPKRARALCVNCSRKFSLFVRKTRCRVCGEVVCQPCAPQVMISTKRGPIKTRVCTKCYHLSPGDEYEPIGGLPNSQNGGDPRRMQNETRYSDILQDNPDVYHEADEDSMDEDEDEDGLEEQSDYSVFAQSRFTEASRDSVATSNFEESSNFESHFEGSSQFDATSELDDSQYYDGGARESSFVSESSTSHWQGGNSTASSMMGWNQASSVKPADGYIYDPQASLNSNFYGASKYGESDCGVSNCTVDEEPDKRGGRYKAAAPIPEDEPDSHNGYSISPNTSYNSSPSTNYNSAKSTNYDASYASSNSNASHGSKTVSIQSLAKARSARYGIKSQFPPLPPPPPPLSPPPEEADEDDEDDSPLHLGALKSDNTQNSKFRKPKGIAARKMFTPPPPKETRRENGPRTSANRVPKIPQKEFRAAVGSKDSRSSQTSSRESTGLGSTRSSAILQQVRRNRNRTLELTPDSDRTSAVLKTLEEEHLNRMREIERMQELAKEKAARRSMTSNGSRSSMQSTCSSQPEGRFSNARASAAFAAAVKKTSQPRNAPLSPSGPPPGSPHGPPPGSPPGTPPSMRGRRMPPFNQQANQSFGDRSRRTDTSIDFGGSRFLSTRSNGTFAKSNVRVSVAPSAQSEDLMFNSQRSGLQASNGSKGSSRGRRLDASQASSKSSSSSFGSRRLDASQASSIPMSKHPDDLAFDASQLSVDKSKFSSSIAILETPADSTEHIAMMERLSSQRGSNASTLFDEDLLAQSSSGMTEHINSIRARAAYQLPDEEDRVSDELLKRQQEHRRRMEELTKLTANHVVEDNIRDSASSLGGLHDSSVSLNGFRDSSGNHFGDSSVSSASSVDIDDDEFNFESRPLGRTKRSGTIPFSLEELGQVPDADEDDEESEGPDESDTSFRLSEDPMDHEHGSELEDVKPSYRPTENIVEHEHNGTQMSGNTSYRPSVESLDHKQPLYRSSDESVELEDSRQPAYRPSEESEEHEHSSQPLYRSSEDSVEHEHLSQPVCRSSEESVEHGHPSQLAYRSSENSVEFEHPSQTEYVASEVSVEHDHQSLPTYRASEESVEHDHPAYRSSEESVKHEYSSQPVYRSSEDSVEHDHPTYRSSEESVKHEHSSQPAYRFIENSAEHEHPAYRSSEESVKHEHSCQPAYRFIENSAEHEHPAYRSSEGSMKHEHSSQPAYRSSEEFVEHEQPPYRSSEESMKHEHSSQPVYRSSDDFLEHEHPAYRSSEESVKHEHPSRSSEESIEHNHSIQPSKEHEHMSENGQPSYRSSEESLQHERVVNRSSEESVEQQNAAPLYRPSEELKCEPDHAEPVYRSSDESEPENADAANRSSEEPVAPEKSASNFQPYSSQLITGEGAMPVDEFAADSSRLFNNAKLSQVDEHGDGDDDTRSPRDTSEFHQDDLQLIPEEHSMEEYKQTPISSSTISTEASENVSSPRESCASALDESLMNRPTEELFEQVRANRLMYSDGARTSDLHLNDLEASHNRRMEELNRIALDQLGNRISNLDDDMYGSSFQPGRSLHPIQREKDEETEMQWRSTDMMEEYQGRHLQDMERLRRKIRQLEEECRESIASVLTPEEMDLSEFDEDDDEPSSANFNGAQSFNDPQSFNPQSSVVSTKGLSSSTLSQHMPPQVDEPGSARALYDQIAKLTQLQREMAMAEDDDDEAEYRARIKEQYRLLRTIKATSYQLRIREPRSPRKTTTWLPGIYQENRSQYQTKMKSTSRITMLSRLLSKNALTSSAITASALTTNATSTAATKHVGTLDESCVSAFDESLMNRPTEELFEQVRANRPKHSADAVRSSDLQLHDLEASHNRRMEELNRIALDQLGNRISNLGHSRLSSSYQPHSSQLTAGEGGTAVDEFFAGSSMVAANTSSKLAQVIKSRDDRGEGDRSSRETSASPQDTDEEHSSKFASECESNSDSDSKPESETKSKSEYATDSISNSSTTNSAASTRAPTSSPTAGRVVTNSVLASSALSMSALTSSAITASALTTNATSTAATKHVGTLDESCVSAFDESLMNRPTEELFEQVRANRPKHSADAVRSSDLQLHDLEASHNRRMEELNRIALDQLGNRISNLGHSRLSSSYQPHSSQLTAGEGGTAVDEFFAGSSMVAANTSSKLAQVIKSRDDRGEGDRSSRETSASPQDTDEEHSSKFASECESNSDSDSKPESETKSKSEYATDSISNSSTTNSAASTRAPTSSPTAGRVVTNSVLASSALSMSALTSSAITASALTTNATSTAATKHVGTLDESCVSAFDESLMNRPTEELFEQVRANRPKHSADAVRSSDLQLHDLEASHNRRMEELNRIALDQLGNRISNLGHSRLSSSYQPHSSQLTAGEGGTAVDEFFAGSSMVAANTSSKLAQVIKSRDDRGEGDRSSRETSASPQDTDEEHSSKFASECESNSDSDSKPESETKSKSEYATDSISNSSTTNSAASTRAPTSSPTAGRVVTNSVLASSALSMSALTSSAITASALTTNATSTAATKHVGTLDESCVSAFDESLMNRPTEELFEQVRANRPKHSADAVRSSDLQLHDLEASHNRRMEELNRIALDQLGNRISNLGHSRLSSSYQPHSSQLTAGEGGTAVDEFFAGSSMVAANTSSKLAQVIKSRDDRGEGDRSSRETSASPQDTDEEHSSKFASECESNSDSDSKPESETKSKSEYATDSISNSSTTNSAASTRAPTSSPTAGRVVTNSVLASSALSMSALTSSAITASALTTNATSTAATKHVGTLDESCVSAFDESLMNRPTEELFEQVRANRPKHSADAVRSSDLQLHDLEASHNRRMEELNRIALDQLGNRISNLGHSRLSSSYQPHSSQLTAGEGGTAVDEFFAGSSMVAANTSSKLAQVIKSRDDRGEGDRSSRETSASPQDTDEEHSSKFASECESNSDSDSKPESETKSKSEYATDSISNSSTTNSAASTRAPTSSPTAGRVVTNSVLASSALSMSALTSSAITASALTTNATSTAATKHVGTLDESCVSAFDESLMNRPTEELFEQVRANRPKHSADAVRSSDLQLHDLEASHNRRMEELNRIALDQLGNRISNLGHSRLSSSYQPHSSQLTAGEGGTAVDEFFAGSSMVAANTSSKLAQVIKSRDDRGEGDRSSRETSASPQDTDEEHSSKFASECESNSDSDSKPESETKSKSEYATDSISNSSTTNSAASTRAPTSSPTAGRVVTNSVLASSALSMSALTSSAITASALTTNATSTAATKHVGTLDESCVSAFDESLMNRPTEELFEQVRANRPKHSADAVRSSDLQLHDLEASHNRRMEELNRIALDQLGNRISNLGHSRLSSSYQPHSSQLTAGEGGTAVDKFFAGSSMVAANTSSKLAQVIKSRDDRGEGDRSSRETSASPQDTDEEHSSKFASECESNSDSDSKPESETKSKSEYATDSISNSSTTNSAASTRAPTSSPTAGRVVTNSVLASSALSMSALTSSAITASALTTNATSTAATKHVGTLDESCVSAFDESLMNRPTEELFEQVRANRPKHSADAVRSSDLQLHDLEASHNRRLEELNRIALDQLGNRISNLDDDVCGTSNEPGWLLDRCVRDEDIYRENDIQRNSTDKKYQRKNQRELESLRRKICQLEQECLESNSSSTPKEMDLSELTDNNEIPKCADHSKMKRFNGTQSFHGNQSFNPQSSFISMEDLSSSTLSQVELDTTCALQDQIDL